jgi:phage terminase small subunit
MELSRKQEKFADEYVKTGNATEAAMAAYKPKNRNTAHSIGSENLRKPAITAYLERKAAAAAEIVYELSQGAKSEAVRLGAARDLLDRTGYFINKRSNILEESSILIINLVSFSNDQIQNQPDSH